MTEPEQQVVLPNSRARKSVLGSTKSLFSAKASARQSQAAKRQSLASDAVPTGIKQLKAVLEESTAMGDASERLTRRERALHDVINELLATEAKYLADLRFAVREYAVPLKQMLPTPQLHYDVFSNLEQLEALHSKLEADLTPARACLSAAKQRGTDRGAEGDPDDGDGSPRQQPGENVAAELASLVAQAFQPLLPFFMMYATYCGKYTDAPTRLIEARKRKAVEALVVAKEVEVGTTLEQMLFRPVQRMCVYPLLFKQALRVIEGGSGQATTLQLFTSCFDAVGKTITQVNENVREQEADAHTRGVLVHEVQGAAHLISPTRRLVSEAELEIQRCDGWLRGGRKASKLYIFNDLLLVCRPSTFGSTLRLKVAMELCDVDVASNAGEGMSDKPTPAMADAPRPAVATPAETPRTHEVKVRRAVKFADSVDSGDAPGASGSSAQSDDLPGAGRIRWMDATHMILERSLEANQPKIVVPRGSLWRPSVIGITPASNSPQPPSPAVDAAGEICHARP